MYFKFIWEFLKFSYQKYSYPFPAELQIGIDANPENTHTGIENFAIDFLVPEGTIILAAADGNVVLVVDHHIEGGDDERFAEKANHIVISHGEEFSFYFHLSFHGAQVKTGDRVLRGQPIAIQGSTGYTTEPHIHFAIYRNGRSVRARFEK